jgi:sec-independent protein translocase protein TatA
MAGWAEILVVALVILLVFGASRVPAIGRAFGKAVAEFKRAAKGPR